jgi:hypothetical protein
LRASDENASSFEIVIGDIEKAVAFIDELAGMFQLFAERDDRHRCFRRGHDPAPVRPPARINAQLAGLFSGIFQPAGFFHRKWLAPAASRAAGAVLLYSDAGFA